MNLARTIDALISRQYRCPSGLLGRWFGERMVRQHEAETGWTVSLLEIMPADHVLEIGCGAGRAIQLAAAQVPEGQVAGIDLSPVMVRAARRRNARSIQTGRVVVRQGDVTHLPFADAAFDKVFSIHTVYFWPDPPSAVAELRRVLNPGGRLALTLTTGKLGGDEAESAYFRSLLEDRLLPELKPAGFDAVSVAKGPDSRDYQIAAILAR
jgi:ubiquinone/menaquinone biosynthesis C-methylase UbiE